MIVGVGCVASSSALEISCREFDASFNWQDILYKSIFIYGCGTFIVQQILLQV